MVILLMFKCDNKIFIQKENIEHIKVLSKGDFYRELHYRFEGIHHFPRFSDELDSEDIFTVDVSNIFFNYNDIEYYFEYIKKLDFPITWGIMTISSNPNCYDLNKCYKGYYKKQKVDPSDYSDKAVFWGTYEPCCLVIDVENIDKVPFEGIWVDIDDLPNFLRNIHSYTYDKSIKDEDFIAIDKVTEYFLKEKYNENHDNILIYSKWP